MNTNDRVKREADIEQQKIKREQELMDLVGARVMFYGFIGLISLFVFFLVFFAGGVFDHFYPIFVNWFKHG